jgi:phenylalanyl-tRNA synthetase beta chain
MLGAPVDEVVDVGGGLGDIVIARVEEVRQHPNADRLRICTVDAGGEPLQVVCGAPNVEAGGRYYPSRRWAPAAGGDGDRPAKLRGERSEGMLCSARELGLGRDHAGLLALNGEWEPGTGFRDALGLDDAAGRGRHPQPGRAALAPGRRARAGARRRGRHRAPRLPGDPATTAASSPGEREGEAAGCRWRSRTTRGARATWAPWCAGCGSARRRSGWRAAAVVGVRPINNVVDATNYVLHELGQPIHAFDLDRCGAAASPSAAPRGGDAGDAGRRGARPRPLRRW